MYVVTGGAGFIGSNLVKTLNDRGETDIFVVDNLTDGKKMHNLADLKIADYMDRLDFIDRISAGANFHQVSAIFHLGATSVTTEWDGRFVMKNNYEYSKSLLHWCLDHRIAYLYASSAAVYGTGPGFRETPAHEHPINIYAYSKFLFDQYVRRQQRIKDGFSSQVIGLRYFNVYGPREQHKGSMASTAFHFNNQIKETGKAWLFSAHDGYDAGEQRRDFVSVDDCVKVNLWFLENGKSGIYNVGTGSSETFNEMATAVINWHRNKGLDGTIEYIPFPDHLKDVYQSFTQADLTQLREAGYTEDFKTVTAGVNDYLDWLND